MDLIHVACESPDYMKGVWPTREEGAIAWAEVEKNTIHYFEWLPKSGYAITSKVLYDRARKRMAIRQLLAERAK